MPTTKMPGPGEIITFTGAVVNPRAVTGPIYVRDIVHALSNIARYNGHTRQFYSVAQHSVLLSQLPELAIECAEQRLDYYEMRAWALLHDAAEAYLGDIPRPMKTDEDRACEEKWLERIIEHVNQTFNLRLAPRVPDAIKKFDTALLQREIELLINTSHVDPAFRVSDVKITVPRIDPLNPAEAANLWETAFAGLSCFLV